jgi:uridine phosphorylase
LGNQNELWAKIGVKAIEMEVSTLFVIASLRGVRAGAILNVDNYIFDRAAKNEDYNPHKQAIIEVLLYLL